MNWMWQFAKQIDFSCIFFKLNVTLPHQSSEACGEASISCVRPVRWDENARTETAHISTGEGEGRGNHCGRSRQRVQSLEGWRRPEIQLHTLSAGRRIVQNINGLSGAGQSVKGWRWRESCVPVCSPLQENLKRLRESITRRHKERQKAGKELGRVLQTSVSYILNHVK